MLCLSHTRALPKACTCSASLWPSLPSQAAAGERCPYVPALNLGVIRQYRAAPYKTTPAVKATAWETPYRLRFQPSLCFRVNNVLFGCPAGTGAAAPGTGLQSCTAAHGSRREATPERGLRKHNHPCSSQKLHASGKRTSWYQN